MSAASPVSSQRPAPRPEATWVRVAFGGVVGLAAVLYLVNLTVSGWANTYYSAAALAASQSWPAWFFGSFDAANFITVDKPPLSTMLIGLAVRLFGLSPWTVLLPEALAGVATVAVLFDAVRRQLGPLAATIAGLVAALTPAAVLIFRYNNPDALLTLLLVLAAWVLVRGLETGGIRWAALAAVLVGLAFNTKYLQAYLVLPAFALTWAIAAPGSVRRRFAGLLAAAVAVLASSAWWIAVVELIPAASRPYIGGSDGNSALELVFGYNGLQRIFGFGGPPGGGSPTLPGGGVAGPAGGGPGFSGTPGPLRLFNEELGGQVAWLLPLAAAGLVVGLLLRGRASRTDPRRAGYILWGTWLAVHVLVFSFMSGIIHSYYTVTMAPAIGALAGGGVEDLWRLRARGRAGGLPLAATIAGSALLAWVLLSRTPTFAPGLGTAILVGGGVAALLVAVPGLAAFPVRRLELTAATMGLAVLLAGPLAYAADTMQTAYGGGDPAAGPSATPGPGGAAGFQDGGFTGGPLQDGRGVPPAGAVPPGAGPGAGINPGGIGPGVGGTGGNVPGGNGRPNGGPGAVSQVVVDYLLANRGSATWIVAANGSMEAGAIELATREPVMAMGGFNGSDPAPSLAQLEAYIASGQLRFVVAGGGGRAGRPGGPGGGAAAQQIQQWVVSHCQAVMVGTGAAASLYDCVAAA